MQGSLCAISLQRFVVRTGRRHWFRSQNKLLNEIICKLPSFFCRMCVTHFVINHHVQEIGRMMQEVLKLEHDVALLRRKEEIGFRRYVFPEVYPNTAK